MRCRWARPVSWASGVTGPFTFCSRRRNKASGDTSACRSTGTLRAPTRAGGTSLVTFRQGTGRYPLDRASGGRRPPAALPPWLLCAAIEKTPDPDERFTWDKQNISHWGYQTGRGGHALCLRMRSAARASLLLPCPGRFRPRLRSSSARCRWQVRGRAPGAARAAGNEGRSRVGADRGGHNPSRPAARGEDADGRGWGSRRLRRIRGCARSVRCRPTRVRGHARGITGADWEQVLDVRDVLCPQCALDQRQDCPRWEDV